MKLDKTNREPEDIREPLDKNKVYRVFLEQLNMIERSTISVKNSQAVSFSPNCLPSGN